LQKIKPNKKNPKIAKKRKKKVKMQEPDPDSLLKKDITQLVPD